MNADKLLELYALFFLHICIYFPTLNCMKSPHHVCQSFGFSHLDIWALFIYEFYGFFTKKYIGIGGIICSTLWDSSKCSILLFGGIAVILMGDFAQLPPTGDAALQSWDYLYLLNRT